MLLTTIVLHQPQQLAVIAARTPGWAWGLLAGLLALGAGQLRDRTVGLARVSLMPVAMAGFSAWGMASAFGASPLAVPVLSLWLAVAAAAALAVGRGRPAATYDAARREYRLPGSALPLVLIAAIFTVKWSVGVEMALQPSSVQDAAFALPVAAVYGVITGLFVGRAARLWRLALRPAAAPATA